MPRKHLIGFALAAAALAPVAAQAGGPRYSFNLNYGSPYYYEPFHHRPYWRGHHHYRFQPAFVYPVPVIREYEVSRIVEPAPALSGPPPSQNWYLCEEADEYYPYVSECPGGWTTVPATPRK